MHRAIFLVVPLVVLSACDQQGQSADRNAEAEAVAAGLEARSAGSQSSSSSEVVGYSVMMGGGQYVLFRTPDGALEYCYYFPDGSLQTCAVLQTR